MHKEVETMTVCRGCQLIECIHNTRTQPPKCTLDEIELNNKRECAMSEIDHQYLRNQLREKSARV